MRHERLLDAHDRIVDSVLDGVLPNSDDMPATSAQSTKVASVAYPIFAKFVSPKRRELVFPHRKTPAVPEITVYKDGDLLFGKNDIRTSR